MKSYGQYCGLAKALDHIGDRWSLLVVRELLLGPARFSDLRDALPGIATNLLTERLRSLEADGVIRRVTLGRPVRATAYELTGAGRELEDAVGALVRWGGRWMVDGPQPGDVFQPRWLATALRSLLAGPHAGDTGGRVEIRAAGESVTVAVSGGRRTVELGAAEPPDAVVEAEPATVLGVASGAVAFATARRRRSVKVRGDAAVAEALLAPGPA